MPSLGWSFAPAAPAGRQHPGVNRGKGRGITKPAAGKRRRKARR